MKNHARDVYEWEGVAWQIRKLMYKSIQHFSIILPETPMKMWMGVIWQIMLTQPPNTHVLDFDLQKAHEAIDGCSWICLGLYCNRANQGQQVGLGSLVRPSQPWDVEPCWPIG